MVPHKTVWKKKDTKAKRLAQQRAAFDVAIQEWWRGKLESGQIFTSLANPENGLDYVGELPWPDEVSAKAMYSDFVLSCPDTPVVTKWKFGRAFRGLSKVRHQKYRDTSPRRDDGRILMRTHSMFYCLRKLED